MAKQTGSLDLTAAKKAYESIDQYFWYQTSGADAGAHITEVPQDAFTDPTDPDYHTGGNLLARSTSVAVRNGLKDLAVMSQDGFDAKTYDSNDDEVVIAHLGYGPGNDDGGSTSDAPYYTFGTRTGTVGNYSVAEGFNTEASGYCSHAEGEYTTASEVWAHAEGGSTTASEAHAHAEGQGTTASGYNAHAEGGYTNATGVNAHAEGEFTTASGGCAHSQNDHTVADQSNQTAIGQYNTKNNTNNLFAIGNGTADNARSDAFQVDISGNVALAGAVQSFFKIVEVSVSVASISAHNQNNLGTQTVPAADRPSGMVLVGTVGYQCGNYRIVPYNYYVTGAHTFTLAMVNTTASSSAATTFTAKLLYMKATSA